MCVEGPPAHQNMCGSAGHGGFRPWRRIIPHLHAGVAPAQRLCTSSKKGGVEAAAMCHEAPQHAVHVGLGVWQRPSDWQPCGMQKAHVDTAPVMAGCLSAAAPGDHKCRCRSQPCDCFQCTRSATQPGRALRPQQGCLHTVHCTLQVRRCSVRRCSSRALTRRVDKLAH